MVKSKLSPEHKVTIGKLVKLGLKTTDIERKLRKDNEITDDISYQNILLQVNKTKNQTKGDREKHEAEVQIINDLSTLTKTMTSWVNQLREEYNKAKTFESVGSERFPVIIQPKRDIRNSIDRNFGHFISLLKTPAIAGKGTEVNIGLQNMQIAYDQVIAKNKAKLYGTNNSTPIDVSISEQRTD